MLRFYASGNLCADEHAESQRKEDQQSLRLRANLLWSCLIRVYLTSDEEKVVANSVKHDSQDNHPRYLLRSADCKQPIARHPCEHPYREHPLDTQAHEKERHDDHEKDLRH